MTEAPVTLDWWLDQLQDSGRELAVVCLNAARCECRERSQGWPKSFAGSCVALVGDKCAAEIGICTETASSDRLAMMMLGFGEGEELDEETVGDAICELANILAGLVKTRVAATIPGFRLGLPVFFRGSMAVPAGSESGSVLLDVDGIAVRLLVLRSGSG